MYHPRHCLAALCTSILYFWIYELVQLYPVAFFSLLVFLTPCESLFVLFRVPPFSFVFRFAFPFRLSLWRRGQR